MILQRGFFLVGHRRHQGEDVHHVPGHILVVVQALLPFGCAQVVRKEESQRPDRADIGHALVRAAFFHVFRFRRDADQR